MTTALAGTLATPARPWGRAARWLLLLGPFFFISYGAANWLAAMRAEVGSVVFAWESRIPFVPWTIVPYWSIDILYGISLFVCASERELDIHARRLLTAQVVAVTCFILLPLRFTFVRPEVHGVAGLLFDSLGKFDKPFNQAPSLHIALLVILWDCYARHLPRRLRWAMHAWFTLIGLSVLTTWQHHFFDAPTGALLGFICLWLWPDGAISPGAAADFVTDPRRWRLAAYYAAGSALLAVIAGVLGGIALWLLWPAISLALVALNYAVFGATGFQKGADGKMSIAARWLLAPYIAGAWINSQVWTRNDAAPAAVRDGVLLGRLPSRRVAARYADIFDLCAELPAAGGGVAGYQSVPMLDLIPPAPDRLRQLAIAIERSRHSGPVLVCCALGYGRSAAAVAAWLLMTGRAADADAAIGQIRQVRQRAVLGDAVAAITAAATPVR